MGTFQDESFRFANVYKTKRRSDRAPFLFEMLGTPGRPGQRQA
jgi:hypothetical protein